MCWTYGSQAARGDIEATLERLRSFRQDKLDTRQSIQADINETKEQISEYEQAQRELDQLNQRLAKIETKIEQKRSRIEDLEARRDEVHDEIDALEEAVEQERTSDYGEVLDLHKQANAVELKLEQKEEALASRWKVTENQFELQIVRESESGRTYEGTVDTLSESEREVVGLMFALAGYLVHELYKTVPVMVLDSLEATDADRIARLVDYFADYPGFLLVALLPGDANGINVDHEMVTKI